jgi:uncharacterized membrane protein
MHESRARRVVRVVLAVAMVSVGCSHFVVTDAFARIVPAALPAPRLLVYVSGVAEIAGGVGLLLTKTRRWAGLALIAFYIAVFPANVNTAVNGIQADPAHPQPEWALWLRLPFQALFIWAAWFASRPPQQQPPR